jgi:hypothetical protein
MTKERAVSIAAARPEAREMTVVSARRAIIEIGENRSSIDALPGPGRTCDALVWLVALGDDLAGIEIAVDERSGEVLRLQRTMGGQR